MILLSSKVFKIPSNVDIRNAYKLKRTVELMCICAHQTNTY